MVTFKTDEKVIPTERQWKDVTNSIIRTLEELGNAQGVEIGPGFGQLQRDSHKLICIDITWYNTRTQEQKNNVISTLKEEVAHTLNLEKEDIGIAFTDCNPKDWVFGLLGGIRRPVSDGSGWEKLTRTIEFGGINPETKLKESEFINKVGLFGVCGDSTWRQNGAIPKLEAAGVDYFNPQVANWNPECAAEESRNLTRDRVLIFPITKDTTAIGSLAELGWAAFSAALQGQKFGVFVEMYVTEGLDEKANSKTDTNRARKLVISHMNELLETHPELKENMILAENMDQLIDWSIAQMKNKA